MATDLTVEGMALKQIMESMTAPGELYEALPDGRLHCYACGHDCKIPEGRAGVCRIRFNDSGTLKVPRGYVGALACDPIEKKPYFHAFPGRNALSFGMLGCDLHCGYCQNWVTSQTLRDPKAVSPARPMEPSELVDLALRYDSPIIVSTYNEPLITSEWAVEVMRAGHERGLVGGYVSNGNATPRVLEYLRPHVQCYKVDLKSFQDREYRKLGGQLAPVKQSIRDLHAMGFWLEIVTLIVPGLNDDPGELREMAAFLHDISPDIPWHVTSFHADFKMQDTADTQTAQIIEAAEIGAETGLRYVYAGNRPGAVGQWENTRCPTCDHTCIARRGFHILKNDLEEGHCPKCATPIPGFWATDCVIPQEGMGSMWWLENQLTTS